MGWEALGTLADLAGAAGVIASLVYLATQIRHNTRQSVADSYQARADIAIRVFGDIYLSNGIADISIRARSLGLPEDTTRAHELAPTDAAALRQYWTVVANYFDSVQFQYEQGLITEDYYQDVFLPALHTSAPWWRALGLLGRGVLNRASFRQIVETQLAHAPRST